MNTRAAGRGTTTAGIAVTTDAVTTVAAAGERGRQGTRRGVIYQPGYTLTKSATFPENRTTSVSRLLTGSSTVPFHRGGRCFVRLPVSRSLTGSSTVPVHREGGSRQRMSGPSTMSHPALWTCPACGRPLTVALNPEGGEAGAHRPLEISRASAAAHACTPAARFPQFHSASSSSSSSITGYEPASCQPWQPPVSAGAEDDEGVISQSEYTLTKPSSCPNHRDHVRRRRLPEARNHLRKARRGRVRDERQRSRAGARRGPHALVPVHPPSGLKVCSGPLPPPVGRRRVVDEQARGSSNTGRANSRGRCRARIAGADARRHRLRSNTDGQRCRRARPAVAGRFTAPRVVTSSPSAAGSALGYRTPQTSTDGRSLRLVSCCSEPGKPDPHRSVATAAATAPSP